MGMYDQIYQNVTPDQVANPSGNAPPPDSFYSIVFPQDSTSNESILASILAGKSGAKTPQAEMTSEAAKEAGKKQMDAYYDFFNPKDPKTLTAPEVQQAFAGRVAAAQYKGDYEGIAPFVKDIVDSLHVGSMGGPIRIPPEEIPQYTKLADSVGKRLNEITTQIKNTEVATGPGGERVVDPLRQHLETEKQYLSLFATGLKDIKNGNIDTDPMARGWETLRAVYDPSEQKAPLHPGMPPNPLQVKQDPLTALDATVKYIDTLMGKNQWGLWRGGNIFVPSNFDKKYGSDDIMGFLLSQPDPNDPSHHLNPYDPNQKKAVHDALKKLSDQPNDLDPTTQVEKQAAGLRQLAYAIRNDPTGETSHLMQVLPYWAAVNKVDLPAVIKLAEKGRLPVEIADLEGLRKALENRSTPNGSNTPAGPPKPTPQQVLDQASKTDVGAFAAIPSAQTGKPTVDILKVLNITAKNPTVENMMHTRQMLEGLYRKGEIPIDEYEGGVLNLQQQAAHKKMDTSIWKFINARPSTISQGVTDMQKPPIGILNVPGLMFPAPEGLPYS